MFVTLLGTGGNYLYDGANVVTDLNASGGVVASYAQGAGIDEPLASRSAARLHSRPQSGCCQFGCSDHRLSEEKPRHANYVLQELTMKPFIVLLSLTLLLLTDSKGQTNYAGPNCLASFRIDRDTKTATLFQELGSPVSKAGPYCYKTEDGRAFLYIEAFESEPKTAADVFLSDFQNCVHRATNTTPINLYSWKTPEGIGLGSPKADVLKAYGRPSSDDKVDLKNHRYIEGHIVRGLRSSEAVSDIGDESISYNGDVTKDLRAAEFGIRKGKVSWIWLSHNE